MLVRIEVHSFRPTLRRDCVRPLSTCRPFREALCFIQKQASGAVKKSEQSDVVLLGGTLAQFDHRCGLIEHLPASIQDEMIVSRYDFGNDDLIAGVRMRWKVI